MSYRFSLSTKIVNSLGVIERAREAARLTNIPQALAEHLQIQAQLRSTHYSTRIEGNRLTLKEAEEVIQAGRGFPGRERDVREVKNYYDALQLLTGWLESGKGITGERIQKLHGCLYNGKRAKPTPYRDGQNVIRDSGGGIVYLPPEAADVPALMAELIDWIATNDELPAPVVAGVAHYQFETIHPFYDGNGRTGRLLTAWILHRGGYGMGGLYALESYYADDLPSYYDALVTHPHHNYYFGRDEADITPWLEYFLAGAAAVMAETAELIRSGAADPLNTETIERLRPLDARARRVLGLFVTRETITANEVAALLGLSARQARDLIAGWVEDGWLIIMDPSKRGRKYGLNEEMRGVVK